MKTNQTVNVSEINSAGILAEALRSGITTATLLGMYEHPDHPGNNDWQITIYRLGDVRVADTNGDPVWEEDDQQVFAELIEEYEITLKAQTVAQLMDGRNELAQAEAIIA